MKLLRTSIFNIERTKIAMVKLGAVIVSLCALFSAGAYAEVEELKNDVAVTVPSVFGTAQVFYKLVVPKESADIIFQLTSKGGGDADLYIKKGSLPMNTDFDCRSGLSGSNEYCKLSPGGGTYYVRVLAITTITGVKLKGSYAKLDLEKLQNHTTIEVPSVFGSAELFYKMVVPANAKNIDFKLTGFNNADLYVRRGELPTDTEYDCRPQRDDSNESCHFESGGGTYYVRVYAVTTLSGTTLTGSYDAPACH